MPYHLCMSGYATRSGHGVTGQSASYSLVTNYRNVLHTWYLFPIRFPRLRLGLELKEPIQSLCDYLLLLAWWRQPSWWAPLLIQSTSVDQFNKRFQSQFNVQWCPKPAQLGIMCLFNEKVKKEQQLPQIQIIIRLHSYSYLDSPPVEFDGSEDTHVILSVSKNKYPSNHITTNYYL